MMSLASTDFNDFEQGPPFDDFQLEFDDTNADSWKDELAEFFASCQDHVWETSSDECMESSCSDRSFTYHETLDSVTCLQGPLSSPRVNSAEEESRVIAESKEHKILPLRQHKQDSQLRKRKLKENPTATSRASSSQKTKKANKSKEATSKTASSSSSNGNNPQNQEIRKLLEAKAYELINDHEADRLADMRAAAATSTAGDEIDASSITTAIDLTDTDTIPKAEIVSDSFTPGEEEALKYFFDIIAGYNRGSITELRTVLGKTLADNCVFRTHGLRPLTEENAHFTDKVIQRPRIPDLFESMLESFPDSYWRVECCKLLVNQDRSVRTVAGYFNFKATMLADVYVDKIETKFQSEDEEHLKKVQSERAQVQTVQSTGIYVLTLNAQMKIRHFELVNMSDVKKCAPTSL